MSLLSLREDEPEMAVSYDLGRQVNHCLRRAHQRASSIFLDAVGDGHLTPTQWAALVTLHTERSLSQNQLGRLTYMDPATTQGVVLRLAERGLLDRHADPLDRRRAILRLTPAGIEAVLTLLPSAADAHARTLEPLSPDERQTFLSLLARLM